MSPEELRKIREVFEAGAGLEGAELNAFLDRECGGDPALRDEVGHMLAARHRIPAWLERPLDAGRAAPWIPPALEGRELGGYRIQRLLGRGGMGGVYLAERSDGSYLKQVAVKVVQPGPNAAEIVARFQQERQILALLDHPNIARLLDGGATEEGWPYFVMEYVDGERIDRWCNQHRLNVTGRIELFRDVLAAVRYAHQRLVVHRDLKPGNILVRSDGTVKLLDFGIAKVLSGSPADGMAATLTLAGIMTPEYASPEQVLGEPVATMTDIYSLGVVLYELLTGQRPYQLMSAAAHEVARLIAETDPRRPSDVVRTAEAPANRAAALPEGDSTHLSRRLAGDLDSILLMALRKEPERRYSSVESLSDDLQRHLQHRPVTARAPSWRYRLQRFCRRNPGVIAAVGLAAMLFGAGMFALLWQVRLVIQTSQGGAGGVPLFAPVWIAFYAWAVAGFGIVWHFVRPDRHKLAGCFAGGVVLMAGLLLKFRLALEMGWYRSRIAADADPLFLFSPAVWPVFTIAGTVLMMLLYRVPERFGWTGAVLLSIAIGLFSEVRERIWFEVLLPAHEYRGSPAPFFAGWALGGMCCLLALGTTVLLRRVRGPK